MREGAGAVGAIGGEARARLDAAMATIAAAAATDFAGAIAQRDALLAYVTA